MSIINKHERIIKAAKEKIAEILDQIAIKEKSVWPSDRWPPIEFDRPLSIGALGGHGPIRYTVTDYRRGEYLECKFTSPIEFIGIHTFRIKEIEKNMIKITHMIDMKVKGKMKIIWPIAVRPLHDALLEDLFDNVEISVSTKPVLQKWSLWVRFLRKIS
jgi:hypothetical protein